VAIVLKHSRRHCHCRECHGDIAVDAECMRSVRYPSIFLRASAWAFRSIVERASACADGMPLVIGYVTSG
jgi:hypothetical protein